MTSTGADYLRELFANMSDETEAKVGVLWEASSTSTKPNKLRNDTVAFMTKHKLSQKVFADLAGTSVGPLGTFLRGNYKNQWSAVQSDGYWAALRYLASVKLVEKASKKGKTGAKKRSIANDDNATGAKKKK